TKSGTNYLFRDFTELKFEIDREWPIDLTEQILTMLNLSNLEKVHLNFHCHCYFTTSVDVEMSILFERAWNLRLIQITCDDTLPMNAIAHSVICLKLHHHIKRLDTDIRCVEDALVILEQAEYLSNVTFQLLDVVKAADAIIEWLSRRKRDSAYTIDHSWFQPNDWLWSCDCREPVHFWLYRSMNR
ncbi:unnamed protein product, partial [Rotaria magnacalcarata]